MTAVNDPSRVLVTGGAGFIGSCVVDQLADAGVDVVVLDNLSPAAHDVQPDYLNTRARYIWADIRDPAAWSEALDGVGAVCHQAGRVGLGVDFGDVTDYVDDNDVGWAAGLAVMHQRQFAGRVVLASSMVVYGEGRYRCPTDGIVRPGRRSNDALAAGRFEPPCPVCGAPLIAESISEDAPLDPRNVYAATKLHQEHLTAAFAAEHDVDACWLRYHNVYGRRMPRNTPYAGVASIFRSVLEAGRAPQVTEDGGQRRDFVHVDDVARMNVRALLGAGAVTGAVNVASGTPHSVLEMADALATAMGSKPGDARWPVVSGTWRTGDVRHVFASSDRAERQFGHRASTDFAEGLTAFATAPLRASVATK
ncbi:MAG: NAD-dependent epimerase/dehydratase family protein [Ilumatobacteraceae bacterium]